MISDILLFEKMSVSIGRKVLAEKPERSVFCQAEECSNAASRHVSRRAAKTTNTKSRRKKRIQKSRRKETSVGFF